MAAEEEASKETTQGPALVTKPPKCKLCRSEVQLSGQELALGGFIPGKLYHCDRCIELQRAPLCVVCGEPVRDATRGDSEAIHRGCRQCSSCCQLVSKKEARKLVGRTLCPPCWQLFQKFFTPDRRAPADHVKEVFKAWDQDNSGVIEKDEVKRVLHALDPNLSERDLEKLIHAIDTNHNNVIEIDEFMAWLQSDPQTLGEDFEDSFSRFVTSLMRESGGAARHAAICIGEVIMRPDGIMFVLRSGDERLESRAVTNASVDVATFDAEEFITAMECTEKGLKMMLNTGRIATLQCQGAFFGPWRAPLGFHIIGLRTKPTDTGDRIVGVNVAPMAAAKTYESLAALHFAAEQEFLQPLSEMLSKATIDVNGFDATCGGASALMLAAQSGAVGAMRMLLTSKANPDLEDNDGWTALTFASRCGQRAAVNVLLEQQKKARKVDAESTEANDAKSVEYSSERQHQVATSALQEALRHKHNAVARMLLRAGLGPAARGTFAVERAPVDACVLEAPVITPGGGVFAGAVPVKVTWPRAGTKPEGEENQSENASVASQSPRSPKKRGEEIAIFYSLDGRDPSFVGRPYGGAIIASHPHVCIRAMVKQQNGKLRSPVSTSSFTIVHYVVPDELVCGEMKVRIFPDALPSVRTVLASMLGVDTNAAHFIQQTEGIEEDKTAGRWLWVTVQDKLPEYRLHIDMSSKPWASARVKKKKKFLDQFVSELGLLLGEKPHNPNMEDFGNALNVTAFTIDFSLPFKEGEILRAQLADSSSPLRSKSQLRDLLDKTQLEMVNTLASMLESPEYQATLKESLVKTASTKGDLDLYGIGKGDGGLVAVASSKDNIKKLAKVMDKAVRGSVYKFNVNLGTVYDAPEYMDLNYIIDIMNPAKHHCGAHVAAAGVVEAMNAPEFLDNLTSNLASSSLPASLDLKYKASSRPLHEIEMVVKWSSGGGGKKGAHASQNHLDGSCYIFAEQALAKVVDLRTLQVKNLDAASPAGAASKIRRHSLAVGTSISPLQAAGGHQYRALLDIMALPFEVTEVFLVVSAGEHDDMSFFPDVSIEIWDHVASRLLSSYTAEVVPTAHGMVTACMSRCEHGIWTLKGLSLPTKGHAKDPDPMITTMMQYQLAGYSTWERRGLLVKLRVMHRLQYLQQGSTGRFAQMLWQLLVLPTPAFQLVVTWL
mmetsp:Transcript_45582/g.108428  ORF Transcript_45582/g.108428 Transcript_45582/m.108428 type:complete len:1173 (-) Transcript_45582:72-3590(-)